MDACCVRRSSAGRERGSVRRSRVVLAPRPWRYVGGKFAADNGGKKGRFPGESAYKPSNHCAGKAGMSRLYLSNPCAFFLYFSTRCCGRSRRPAFPAPSVQERDNELASPGQIMSREYLRPFEIVWANSLSSRTSEHSERRSGTHNHRTRFYEGW